MLASSSVHSTPAAPGNPGPTAGVDSLPTRIARTFIAPARLFATFRDTHPWVDVLLISTGMAMVAAASQPAEAFLAQMEDPRTRLGDPVEITSGPGEIVRYGRILAAFSALVIHPLFAFALGGLLLLLFTRIGRGEGSFRAYLTVASHALLIPAAGTLVAFALRAITGDPYSEVTIAKLAEVVNLPLQDSRILASVNLFSLWMLGLLAVGVATLDGRRRWHHAAVVLVGLYLLLAVGSSLLPQ